MGDISYHLAHDSLAVLLPQHLVLFIQSVHMAAPGLSFFS